jgi:cytochrome c556
MRKQVHRLLLIAASTLIVSPALADDDPAHERHELMEGVKDAAKPVGEMLQGKAEFNQETVMASLRTFAEAGEKLGNLVPDGSQGGEAAPAIWEDPEGFEEKIAAWREATADAIAAEPATLEDAKPALGPVLESCKNCHESYRIEDE